MVGENRRGHRTALHLQPGYNGYGHSEGAPPETGHVVDDSRLLLPGTAGLLRYYGILHDFLIPLAQIFAVSDAMSGLPGGKTKDMASLPRVYHVLLVLQRGLSDEQRLELLQQFVQAVL